METLLSAFIFGLLPRAVYDQQYFRVKPHDTSVVAGRTAQLHCHVGNRAGLVQWSKDGFLLGYDPDIPGYERYEMRIDHAKAAYTLLVHDARLEDEAQYQCQVGPGNNQKPIRSAARLTVLVPPKHLSINDLQNGSSIEVREAEKVVLQCQALSSKPATILRWFRKNVELMPEASRTTVRREGEKLYTTLSSITLYPKRDSNGSSYTCEALHPALEKPFKTTACLGVLHPPRHPEIVGYRPGDVLHAGDHLTLVCSSSGGKPSAKVEWLRNGKKIESSFTSDGKESCSTISFGVRNTDNNAVYSCTASNPLTPKPLITAIKLSVHFPPRFVSIDGPSEARRDEAVTLICRSDVSNPPAELTWLVDGVAFEPEDAVSYSDRYGWYTTSNLTFVFSRQDKDMKVFACIAYGTFRQENVCQNFNVSVIYPPERPVLSSSEDSLEIKEGDHQAFICSAFAGNPPAELKWYKGDTKMPSISTLVRDNISSIITFQAQASDNGISVRCEVNNSALVTPLVASVKLSIFFSPLNLSISVDPPQPREGDMVRLECWCGSSNPEAQLLWWKGETLLTEHHVEKTNAAYGGISTKSQINFPATSADHGRRFICEAKNPVLQKSIQEQIILYIFHAPVFLTSERVLEVIEGFPIEVNMSARAYPEVQNYRWRKNGTFLSKDTGNLRQFSSAVAEGPVLYFSHVSRQDSGTYTCVAQNAEGSSSATTTLNVLYPATVLNITGATEVAEGESLHLECTADGNPLTEETITWRKVGDSEITLVAINSGSGHSTLTIVNITRKDAGLVECIADNGVGEPSVNSVQLRILHRPSILKKIVITQVAAVEGDEVELRCVAEGYPDVSFSWLFNGSTLSVRNSDSLKHTVSEDRRRHEWRSSLLVKIVNQNDYGIYTCRAENIMGHDFMTFNIAKRSIPDPPEVLETLNISHQGAILTWNPGFDGGLTQSFQLRIRKAQDASFNILHVPANSSSYLLSGLQQGTLYEVSLASKNPLGESEYTTPILFRTKTLPAMGSSSSGPESTGHSYVLSFPVWLLAVTAISSILVAATLLICIVYLTKKRIRRNFKPGTMSSATSEEIAMGKQAKKFSCLEQSPFYLTGTSVDIYDKELDMGTFQQSPITKKQQVSIESAEKTHSPGNRCKCCARQSTKQIIGGGSTLICGRSCSGDECSGTQHEQCPDILNTDGCHCRGTPISEKELSRTQLAFLGTFTNGNKDWPDTEDISFCDRTSPPHMTLTTFHWKSELPICHSITEPKIQTVINGCEEDS